MVTIPNSNHKNIIACVSQEIIGMALPVVSVGTFRAKTNVMKSWRPRNAPSNRDRLELYALHKQAVSGDAPPTSSADGETTASVADRAKASAWQAKRGMSQSDAMARYVDECDRQRRIYGTRDGDGDGGGGGGSSMGSSTSSVPMRATTAMTTTVATATTTTTTTTGGEMSASTSNVNNSGGGVGATPQYASSRYDSGSNYANNGGAGDGGGGSGGVNAADGSGLLCPRGLAAVPLLCAAASESRSAYLARLQVTHPSNGWWAKQEPLCLEVDNPLAIPERSIIALATYVERFSLVLSNQNVLSPRVIQAFLWPVHNVFLCAWICLILATTYMGSLVGMSQTLLFGAKRTNAPLGRLFMEEIQPSARAVESLCEQHQAIGVRVSGLVLMPLMILCDLSTSIVGRLGILIGSLVFVGMGICSWWYWLCILPWLAVCGLSLAVTSGWCFGLIELAGN